MLEWILIVLLAIAGGAGWYFAVTKGISVQQTQIQNNTQTQIQNTGQTTIIEGKDVYQNLRYGLTNVRDLGAFFDTLDEFQKREMQYTRDGSGWVVKYPAMVTESKTNIKISVSTNRSNY